MDYTKYLKEKLKSCQIKPIRQEILTEEIYGKLATTYHRTSDKNNIYSIVKHGFKILSGRSGWMYGAGIYTTYNLESQLTPRMVNDYGTYIIKSKVNLDGFLILNDKKTLPLDKQFRNIVGKDANTKFKKFTEFLKNQEYDSSSDIAQDIWNNYLSKNKNLYTKINGLVFTGDTDGDVVVIYDVTNYIPMSYAECGKNCTDPKFKKLDPIRIQKAKKIYSTNVGMEGSDHWESLDDETRVVYDNLTPKGLDRLIQKNIIPSLHDMFQTKPFNKELIRHAIKIGITPLTDTEKTSSYLDPQNVFEDYIQNYITDYELFDKFLQLNLKGQKEFNNSLFNWFVIEYLVDEDVDVAYNISKILIKNDIIPTKQNVEDLYNMYPPYEQEWKHTEKLFKLLKNAINYAE